MDGGSGGGGGGGGGGGHDLDDIGEFDVGIASEAPTRIASSVSLVASPFPSGMTRMTGVTVMTECWAVPLKLFVSAGTRSWTSTLKRKSAFGQSSPLLVSLIWK